MVQKFLDGLPFDRYREAMRLVGARFEEFVTHLRGRRCVKVPSLAFAIFQPRFREPTQRPSLRWKIEPSFVPRFAIRLALGDPPLDLVDSGIETLCNFPNGNLFVAQLASLDLPVRIQPDATGVRAGSSIRSVA